MIASTHEEVWRIAHFPRKQENDNLYREWTSVNKVTIEEVWILLGRVTIQLKNIQ